MNPDKPAAEPSRLDIEALPGLTVLEFGTNWCGFCRAAKPAIRAALDGQSGVRHIKVEDGPGRPLGRSFRIKLWPTLVILNGGQEIARVVRPRDQQQIAEVLRLP